MAEFDSSHPLDKGQDLTVTYGAGAGAINTAIDEATPSTRYGFVIVSNDTPPVSGTDAWRKRCLWLKQNGAGAEINEVYYYDTDLGSWELLENILTIIPDDSSVGIAQLNATGEAALRILRVNAANNGLEFVPLSSILTANSIPVADLVNAAGAGYVLYSDAGGVWTSSLLTTLLNAWFATKTVNVSQVYDLDNFGSANQVPYLPSTGSALTFQYVDQLLRANMLTTDRLKYTGLGGKLLQVNAGATDVQGVDPTTLAVQIKAAVIKSSAVAGTAGQSIAATTATTLLFGTEVDPDSIVSVAAGVFTLATGTYTLDFSCPFYSDGGQCKAIFALIDVTAANAVLATATEQSYEGNGWVAKATLKHVVKITGASNQYAIQIYASQACKLQPASASNLGTYAETYQQCLITKIA